MGDQTVEEWARTARFSPPVRLGDVEAGILARRPASSAGLGWWYPFAVVLGWAAMGLALVLGPGIALLGLGAAWLGTSDDPPGDPTTWLWVAHLIFVIGAIAEACVLIEAARTRHREWYFLGTAALTAVASGVAFELLRSSPRSEPFGLTLAAFAMGVLAVGVFVVSVLTKPRPPGPNAARKPPKRGPANDNLYWHYVRTRAQVLDTLIERGLLKVDEADRRRLNEMPLGYWEELDDVDERERRRILEYRIFGWREFDESDRREWSPPTKHSKREV